MADYEYNGYSDWSTISYPWGYGSTRCWIGAYREITDTVVTVYMHGAVQCDSSYNLSGYGVHVVVGHNGGNDTSAWSTENSDSPHRGDAVFNGTSAWLPSNYCQSYDEFKRTTYDYNVTFYCQYWGETVNGNGGCNNSGTAYTTVTIPKLDSYDVSYNANCESYTGEMSGHTICYGDYFSIKDCEFTRSGYSFVGWTSDPNGKEDGYGWYTYEDNIYHGYTGTWTYRNDQYGISDNKLVLYAMWEANIYKVSLDMNDGTEPSEYEDIAYGSAYGTLPTPTRAGYTFVGWYTHAVEGTEVSSTTEVSIPSDHSLYAHWDAIPYNYTLGSTVGAVTTGSTQSGSYGCGSTIKLSAYAETGYTWSKWQSSKPSLQPDITSANATFKMPAGDLTMTPIAVANTYKIIYDANGGSGAPQEQSYAYAVGGKTSLSLTKPTKQGYDFLGWAMSPNESAANYYAGDDFEKVTSDTILYAVWVVRVSQVAIYNSSGELRKGMVCFKVEDANLVTNDGLTFKDSNDDFFITNDSSVIHYGIMYIYDQDGNPRYCNIKQ